MIFKRIKASATSLSCRRLVFGKGINDSWYEIAKKQDGKRVMCPYYRKWHSMIKRCYSAKYLKEHPTYIGCSVSKEWLRFSTFLKWMEGRFVKGLELDKDIKIPGNKTYGEDGCMFVTRHVNSLLNKSLAQKGPFPTGVSFHKGDKRYRATCHIEGKQRHIGAYLNPIDAERAYIKAKKVEIIRVSKLYPDIEHYIAQHADLIQEPV